MSEGHGGARAILRHTALSWLRLRQKARLEQARHVLILAHMRSGTHLLHHLLCQHRDVAGTGERNQIIAAPDDLEWLERQVLYNQRRFFRFAPNVVDILNHDRFLPNPELLNQPSVRCLLLIRRPEAAISSMEAFLGNHYGTSREEAVAYYRQRLKTLARYAEQAGREHSLFVPYEALTADPAKVLRAVANFLDLSGVLRPRFVPDERQGQQHSAHLESGHIINNLGEAASALEGEMRAALERTWEACRETMAKNCRGVDEG